MIDTHTHLYLEEFDADREEVMQRAFDSGVSHLVFPNVDLDTVDAMCALHQAYPEHTSIAMGLHPTSVGVDYREQLDRTISIMNNHLGEFIAVGEIGMDLYWDKTFIEEQKIVLREQLEFAYSHSLPVIIHCREALDEIISVIKDFPANLPSLDFHSFTGTPDEVKRLRQLGDFYFGVNGIATFKNSNLDNAIREIGIDRILLETDAPYLAPGKKRGKRNESSFLPIVAEKIAQLFDTTLEEIDKKTSANAKDFFKKCLC